MTREFINSDGYILTDTKYDIDGEKVLLKNTNRYHKIYYCNQYRADASPYIKINNHRYYLSDFLQASFK